MKRVLLIITLLMSLNTFASYILGGEITFVQTKKEKLNQFILDFNTAKLKGETFTNVFSHPTTYSSAFTEWTTIRGLINSTDTRVLIFSNANLKAKIDLLPSKSQFYDDFKSLDFSDWQKFGNDPNLIDTYKNVTYLTTHRGNFKFIEWLHKAKNSNLPTHLKGEVNSYGKAVGCHLQSAVDGVRVKILPSPPAIYAGAELVSAKIEINGVTKVLESTFFPSSWNEIKVFEEASYILSNSANQVNARTFEGIATDGVTKIKVKLTGANLNSLSFDTIFPY
ncbi:MAG: EndoU domain-containing protein [Emticicia sp.]|nr:EndoU domain-containing protein [Emticicia sp.]